MAALPRQRHRRQVQTWQVQVQRGSRAIQNHGRRPRIWTAAVNERRGFRAAVVDPPPQLTDRGGHGTGIKLSSRACGLLEMRADGET
jgi:hypothetical protein